MRQKDLQIAFVGAPITDDINHFAGLTSYLPQQTSRKLNIVHWPDAALALSNLPRLASNDIVIINWCEYAFLLARFLRAQPDFPAKVVLYSGVLVGAPLALTSLKVKVPIEIADNYSDGQLELELGLTVENINNLGMFDYFISKVNRTWSQHTWVQVMHELETTPPVRSPLAPERCVPYFAYRWRNYNFTKGQSHINIILRESNLQWYESAYARQNCLTLFQKRFEEEIMEEHNEIVAKPLWGKPKITARGPSRNCFILMPFGEPFDTIHRDHIVEPLAELGITAVRGDNFYSVNSVMQDIWNGINDCLFIIAELSTRNPNVMYELGIAHALGKRAMLICQNDGDVPFDFRHLRYYKYDYTPRGCAKLERQIVAVATEILSNPS